MTNTSEQGVPISDRKSIALALSGGGFRATLYHLGVIRFLYETGELKSVTRICSVSGGSILGAHLVLNWERYNGTEEDFSAAAQEVVQFAMSNVRRRVVFRWFLSWLLIFPRFRPDQFSRINLLRREYAILYKNQTLHELRSSLSQGTVRPELHILATSMTTGDLCSFTSRGLELEDKSSGVEQSFAMQRIPIDFAVAASSAFPPVFPPVKLAGRDFAFLNNEFRDHALTDGGVYDNLGCRKLVSLQTSSRNSHVIISDAGGSFDWSTEYEFTNLVKCTWRTTEILMKRIAELESQQIQASSSFGEAKVFWCNINDNFPLHSGFELDETVQRLVRLIRTDLDRFSATEVHALVTQGFLFARKTCQGEFKLLPNDRQLWNDKDLWSPVHSSIFSQETGSFKVHFFKELAESHLVRLGLIDPYVSFLRKYLKIQHIVIMALAFVLILLSIIEFYWLKFHLR
ncbi:MAG: patatin-like phospholipase family protein [Pirellulales bacterium]